MKSSIFVLAIFILTCQSSARKPRKMDSWRSEQFVPYIKECLGKINLLFPIQPSYQITLSKNQACRPLGLTNILSNTEIQNLEIFTIARKIERINAKQIIRNWVYLVETKMWRARDEQLKKEITQLFNEYDGCDLGQKLAELE